MSDFDFDELDKAVAGVLTTEADDEPKKDTVDSFSPPTSSPQVVAPVDSGIVEEVAAPVIPSVPPAARRSSGRFMDVVHPSSDMRSRSTFVAPRNTTPVAPLEVAPRAAETPANEPIQKPTQESSQEETDSSTLDGMMYEDNWDKPLESPFLPGAKVEKRPLGGFGSPNIPLDTLEEQLLLEASDEPLLEAHTMPDPIDFASHANSLASESEDTGETVDTPQELESLVDNVKPVVELKETSGVIEIAPVKAEEVVDPTEPKETPQQAEAQIPSQPEVEKRETTEPVQAAEPATSPATVGSGSITQQYTEQPSVEAASGSIYDTEDYHQALPVVTKKHSGAWIFVWILALVIFGAGAGVVFYLFILPMI